MVGHEDQRADRCEGLDSGLYHYCPLRHVLEPIAGRTWYSGENAAALFPELLASMEAMLDDAATDARWRTHGVRYQLVETFVLLGGVARTARGTAALGAGSVARLLALRDRIAAVATAIGEYQFTTILDAQQRRPAPPDAVRAAAVVQLDSLIGVVNSLRRRVVAEPDRATRRAMLSDLLLKCAAIGDNPGLVKAALIGFLDALERREIREAMRSLVRGIGAAGVLEVRWWPWLRVYVRSIRHPAH